MKTSKAALEIDQSIYTKATKYCTDAILSHPSPTPTHLLLTYTQQGIINMVCVFQ